MNFWEAYQLMKTGEWCQRVGNPYAKFYGGIYRYANDRWEMLKQTSTGQGVWNEKEQRDHYEYGTFSAEYDDGEYDFAFSIEDNEAEWEVVDCSMYLSSLLRCLNTNG
jgi:hypothetical protein